MLFFHASKVILSLQYCCQFEKKKIECLITFLIQLYVSDNTQKRTETYISIPSTPSYVTADKFIGSPNVKYYLEIISESTYIAAVCLVNHTIDLIYICVLQKYPRFLYWVLLWHPIITEKAGFKIWISTIFTNHISQIYCVKNLHSVYDYYYIDVCSIVNINVKPSSSSGDIL